MTAAEPGLSPAPRRRSGKSGPDTVRAWRVRPPTLPRHVAERPRLLGALADGEDARVVTVVGPPGAGKTVLVLQWLSSLGVTSFGWVAVDANDNDGTRFWNTFVAALRTCDPALGREALRLLREPDGTDDMIASLLDDLDGVRGRVTVVLDDVHALHDTEVLNALQRLVDHLPPTARLVLCARRDPPLNLSRLRTSGDLFEVRPADLRFTPAETDALFDRLELGDAVGTVERRTLHAVAEGWAVGLQLAALSMRGRGARENEAFVRRFTGTDRSVADFLVAEVLARQPADVRSFLLHTSILDRLSAPLCDAVTGRTDSDAVLRHLEASNLFLVGVDEEHRWFRYHRLFGQLLRAELRAAEPDREPLLHRAAAAWHEAQGDCTLALHHHLRAGDEDRAWGVVAANCVPFSLAGRHATVRSWLASFPDHFLLESPARMVELALAFQLAGQADEAVHWARWARESAGDDPDPALEADVETVLAFANVYWGDGDAAVPHLLAALAHLDAGTGATGGLAAEVRPAWLLVALVGAHLLREDIPAARAAAELELLPDHDADLDVAGSSWLMQRAKVALFEGALREADGLVERAFAGLDPPSRNNPLTGDHSLVRGWLRYERNDLAGAEADLSTALHHAEEVRLGGSVVGAALGLARVAFASGHPDDAFAMLDRARRPVHRRGLPAVLLARVDRAEALLRIAAGDVERARELVDGVPPHEAATHRLRARLALAAGAAGAADRALHAAGAPATRSAAVEHTVLLARAAATHHDDAAALQHLQLALELGRRDRYVRTFVDGGPDVPALLRRLELQAPSAYLREILDADVRSAEAAAEAAAGTGPIEALSARERSVLHHLPSHLTNAEIAAELMISLNTLKSHLKAIYRKLGVTSRSAAVRRARALQLI